MTSDARDGWAIRRADGCNDGEDGHKTWDPWWACCPSNSTKWVIDAENNTRCNTKNALYECPRQCANPDLILWSDPDGIFCCEPDQVGFTNDKGWKGCVTKDELDKGRKSMTVATWEGQPSVTSTSTVSSRTSVTSQTSVTTTTSSQPSSTSPPAESQGSSTNTGAIAGGVVGGVCGALIIVGIVWFLHRRRRPRSLPPDTTFASEPSGPKEGIYKGLGELDNSPKEGQPMANTSPRYELPENQPIKPAQQSPFELHS